MPPRHSHIQNRNGSICKHYTQNQSTSRISCSCSTNVIALGTYETEQSGAVDMFPVLDGRSTKSIAFSYVGMWKYWHSSVALPQVCMSSSSRAAAAWGQGRAMSATSPSPVPTSSRNFVFLLARLLSIGTHF
jgi:hypothetical protein